MGVWPLFEKGGTRRIRVSPGEKPQASEASEASEFKKTSFSASKIQFKFLFNGRHTTIGMLFINVVWVLFFYKLIFRAAEKIQGFFFFL